MTIRIRNCCREFFFSFFRCLAPVRVYVLCSRVAHDSRRYSCIHGYMCITSDRRTRTKKRERFHSDASTNDRDTNCDARILCGRNAAELYINRCPWKKNRKWQKKTRLIRRTKEDGTMLRSYKLFPRPSAQFRSHSCIFCEAIFDFPSDNRARSLIEAEKINVWNYRSFRNIMENVYFFCFEWEEVCVDSPIALLELRAQWTIEPSEKAL